MTFDIELIDKDGQVMNKLEMPDEINIIENITNIK